MTASIKHIGDKLVVGALDVSFLDATSKLVPGTAVLNGPVYIGLTASIGVPKATCMIGPPIAGLAVPASLHVEGLSNFIGNTNQIGAYTCSGSAIFNGSFTGNGSSVLNGSEVINSSVTINGPLIVNGATNINGFLSFTSSIVGTTKLFDIVHPTKKNYRLAHACIEGPENAVFFRGKLVDTNYIEIPEYWKGLVDLETITVHLTPHEFHQELYVRNIEWGRKINIVNNCGGKINCSYLVQAERKDVAKLVVEYESSTPLENSKIVR